MFTAIPTYGPYRTLYLQDPMMNGEDVYALQKALGSLGYSVGTADGVLGPNTDRAIRAAQKAHSLLVDGKAGGKTQAALALGICVKIIDVERVPAEAMHGQLEHESGFRLGIYSPPRPDGSYDAGVAQRNTQFTPPQDGFNPALSIIALAQNTRKHFDLFAGVEPIKRQWALAQGAWNAPAFACYLARAEGAFRVTPAMTARPSAVSRTTFEEYMTKVSKYL